MSHNNIIFSIDSRYRNYNTYKNAANFSITPGKNTYTYNDNNIINCFFQLPTFSLMNLKNVEISGNFITKFDLCTNIGGGSKTLDFSTGNGTGSLNPRGKTA